MLLKDGNYHIRQVRTYKKQLTFILLHSSHTMSLTTTDNKMRIQTPEIMEMFGKHIDEVMGNGEETTDSINQT